MNKFNKRLITSISLSLVGLIIVLNVESWARLSGELNKNILLTGIVVAFALVIISLSYLFKTNVRRKKNHIIVLLFTSFIPLSVFVMNGLLFTVWFIGK
ncbi:MAG: hypothetical protein K0Q87_3893 [Neobacillus sp.]|jgi:hypothetical protein|nr:hypothetical protein [Neobacillus sp.]